MKIASALTVLFIIVIGTEAFCQSVQVVSRESIYSIEDQTYSPHNQVHFPFLYESPKGIWYMSLRHGPHGWARIKLDVSFQDQDLGKYLSDDTVQTVMSDDRGKTWRPWPGLTARDDQLRFFHSRLKSGRMVSHGHTITNLRNAEDGVLTGDSIYFISEDDGEIWKEIPCEISGLPYAFENGLETWAVFWGHVRETAEGDLIVVVYGGTLNNETYEVKWANGLLKSTDGGKNWEYVSTICNDPDIGREGANETDIEWVGDRELVAVYRTGTNLHISRSEDAGITWNEPENLEIESAVSPQLLMLETGVLVMTYGDRDVHVMCSNNGGEDWSKPMLLHAGPGTGYTDIQATGPDSFRIVFDSSVFQPGQEVDRNEILRIEMRIIQN